MELMELVQNSVILQFLWSSPYALAATVLIAIAATVWVVVNFAGSSGEQKAEDGDRESPAGVEDVPPAGVGLPYSLKVFYGTQTGTAKRFAESLAGDARAGGIQAVLLDLRDCDPEESLTQECSGRSVCVFVVSTYTDGAPPESASWFCRWLADSVDDFRVQKSMLSGLHYSVFGLGNSLYGEHYDTVGRNLFLWLGQLSGTAAYPLGEGDQNVAQSKHGGIEEDFKSWKQGFAGHVFPVLRGETALGGLKQPKLEAGKAGSCACGKEGDSGDGACCRGDTGKEKLKQSAEDEVMYETSSDEDESEGEGEGGGVKVKSSGGIVDLEDMGSVMHKMKAAKAKRSAEESAMRKGAKSEMREMVTPMLKKSLTKQGYRIVGSHSGVKLCRWTKSMLRGRGGCYKHTFYGIASHQCIETTPSLACANKCVFCWRHHTNPVGTEWRWKMDDPETILKGALENHYQMIKQFRGVPGVKPERLAEGMQPQHCALSLVGEPIMYPEINALVKLLHGKRISTFLVTNAQFPEAIRNLVPVTQLYVSVDASTKDSLKKIDRPLFRDFWPRFISSLEALAEKGQRTVYRLTLVKEWNTEELDTYASLVSKGNPDFIEVKGVTYCGESKASTITMANVPWHEEVLNFVQKFADLLPDYEVACEHEHSNCVLIAHTKFKVDGSWHTWIDYSKFHELIQKHDSMGGQASFTALDYMSPTPEWALLGHSQRGFDPDETRWHRKKNKEMGGC